MKTGLTIQAELTFFEVTIEGRGGDSAREHYYETDTGATFAAALDGHQNHEPIRVTVYQLSDGTHILAPKRVELTPAPAEEEVRQKISHFSAKLKKILGII